MPDEYTDLLRQMGETTLEKIVPVLYAILVKDNQYVPFNARMIILSDFKRLVEKFLPTDEHEDPDRNAWADMKWIVWIGLGLVRLSNDDEETRDNVIKPYAEKQAAAVSCVQQTAAIHTVAGRGTGKAEAVQELRLQA